MMRAPSTFTPKHQRRDLRPGDLVRFPALGHARLWWTVRAADRDRVVLTRQAPFRSAGEFEYTILDWTRTQTAPCNLLGGGWDIDAATVTEDCERLLAELASGEVEPSVRRAVVLDLGAVVAGH